MSKSAVLDVVRHMPFGPASAVNLVLSRDDAYVHDSLQKLDTALFFIEDSIEHEITYKFSIDLVRAAKRLCEAEPDANVVSFIYALCVRGIKHGWANNGPDYDLARDLIGVIREGY